MSLEVLRAIPSRPEFVAGLFFGLVGLVAGLVAAGGRWGRPPARATRTVGIVGLLFTMAVVAGIQWALGAPGWLVVGLAALVAGGAIMHRPAGRWLAPALLLPGIWLLLWRSGLLLESWERIVVGVAMLVGAWLVADFDARWRDEGLGPVLFAASVVGVYSTVPDTEMALVAVGAALPLALLGWPLPLGSLGGGALASTGCLLWIVAAGGVGRASAILGGIASLGLFIVEPAARLFHRAHVSAIAGWPKGRPRWTAAVVVHLGLVYVAARVIGLRPNVAQAAVGALVMFAAAVGAALAMTATRPDTVRGVQA
jgi:hypothetical protein